jgi:purine nucleoside phosphorylase
MYAQWGGDVINMTQYPECYFARELGLCYTAIGSITDYNPGVSDGPSMSTMGTPDFENVLVVFRQNTDKTILALRQMMLNRHTFVGCCCAETSTRHHYED